MTVTPRLIWPIEAQLGEGPAWFPDETLLRFVDIKRGHMHQYNPATGDRATIVLGGNPSFVLPAKDDGLIIGSIDCIRHIGRDGDERTLLTRIPMPARNRTNDATVDRQGRLWFGTMDDDEQRATGALYCFDRGQLLQMGGEAVVTNGPAITGDGQTLYFVDSANRKIWRYRTDEGASLSSRELFLQLTEADGFPDGIVLDSEDCLWVALWDGWAVRRYAPDGTLLLSVAMPCARVTKIAFGDADLSTAYVTTARVGLSEVELSSQPLAGALFAFDAPVAGRALPSVQTP